MGRLGYISNRASAALSVGPSGRLIVLLSTSAYQHCLVSLLRQSRAQRTMIPTYNLGSTGTCSRRGFGVPAAAAQRQRHQQNRSKHRACCSAAASAAVDSTADAVFSVDATPFIGPIQVVKIEGAGRGVVVTRDVSPGEMLLCCHPLAVVTGPQQQRLGVDALQVQLATHISPQVLSWLHQLYDGTQASMRHLPDLQAAAAVQQQQAAQADLLLSLRQQQQQHEQQHTGSNGGISNGSSGNNGSSSSGHQVTDALLQTIMDVVRFNAYSDLHDDLAAAAAAGCDPVSLISLYPEFSFFNHSCVPNCINWVLPGEPRAMVVRAARHIPAGEQATISYLGAPQLLPLDGRQQALGNFGFVCRCGRCVSEEEVPAEVAELLEDVVSRVYQSFTPRLQAALSSADSSAAAAAAAEVRLQASAMMTMLYTQFRRHLIRPAVRQQLLASAFTCLELLADAAAAEGDTAGQAQALQRCLEAAAAVTPGSDLHCIIAAKLQAVTAELSSSSSSSSSNSGGGGGGSSSSSGGMLAAASQAVAAAHEARYGPLSEQQLQALDELNRTLYV